MNAFCDSCGAGLSKRQFNCPHCGYRVVEPVELGMHTPPSQRRMWTPDPADPPPVPVVEAAAQEVSR
jgi:predicted amidophosphoribosyltransferase